VVVGWELGWGTGCLIFGFCFAVFGCRWVVFFLLVFFLFAFFPIVVEVFVRGVWWELCLWRVFLGFG